MPRACTAQPSTPRRSLRDITTSRKYFNCPTERPTWRLFWLSHWPGWRWSNSPFGIGRQLAWYARVPAVGGGASVATLAVANLGVGVILPVDISLVIYLHYLSHLGVFLPAA